MSSSSGAMAGSGGGGGSHQLAVTSLADTQRFNDYHFAAFITQEVPVTIMPRFAMNAVDGLGGRFGPFTPNYPVDVPLWLALYLRQTDACTVQTPSYLRVPWLQEVLEREQSSASGFEPLPFYFFEVTKLLCSSVGGAQADIPAVAEVLRLVGDIKAIRQQKLQRSMAVFEHEDSPMLIPGIKLTSIVNNELLYLRHSFAVVLRQAAELEQRRRTPAAMASVTARPSTASSPDGARTGARRPSSLVDASTVLSGASPSEGGVSGVDGLPTSDTATSPSRTTIAHSEVGVPLTSEAGMLSQETATTMAEMSTAPAPPMKKRRTLRQT